MKVGILTLYHNNFNYGGNLQAYALYKYIKNKGIDAEQIIYAKTKKNDLLSLIKKVRRFGIRGILKKVRATYQEKKLGVSVDANEMEARKLAFQKFSGELIGHSEIVFDDNTICNCLDNYDLFVTGSDQVWNFDLYDDQVYFLNFVDGEKQKKYSYAASFSMDSLSKRQQRIVKDNLKDYAAISVRERKAQELLLGLTEKTVEYVLDPTLLLSQKDWDEVCENRFISEEYVFGYFLGNNIEVVKMAKEYANMNGFKFVMIPFASGKYKMIEDSLADIRIVDASPEKFLSLVKYAEYVFTDSFHAVVFSFIYQKQFFVFNRDKMGTMNSRIYGITELLGLEERFCKTKEEEALSYISELKCIDYLEMPDEFIKIKNKSLEFIDNILYSK